MGQIQSSVNQALGIGSLIAGKIRTDFNNNIIAAENNESKLRKELYNKQLKYGSSKLNPQESKLQKELNERYEDNFNKYVKGDKLFTNTELRRFFQGQNADRNIALDQTENGVDDLSNPGITTQKEGDDPDYDPDDEKRQAAMVEEFNNSIQEQQTIQKPSIQQVMADESANRIDEMTQFKNDTKGLLKLRKDVVSGRLQDLNIKPKIGYSGRNKMKSTGGLSSNRLTQSIDKIMLSKLTKDGPTMEGLE